MQQCIVRRLTSVMCLLGKVRQVSRSESCYVGNGYTNVAPAVYVHSSLLFVVAIRYPVLCVLPGETGLGWGKRVDLHSHRRRMGSPALLVELL